MMSTVLMPNQFPESAIQRSSYSLQGLGWLHLAYFV
jgi:hypothetical protein